MGQVSPLSLETPPTIVPPELYNVPPAPPAIEQSDSLFF